MNELNLNFQAIGKVICDQKYRYEAARQGVFAENSGYIQLIPGCNLEQALEDISGFDHIWVIYAFHLNKNWKPKVSPPIKGAKNKVGVFATRSPHRPNPIGLSCVELIKITGLKIYIRNFDMLDQTPVLDIKPYITACDSFPEASTGWVPQSANQKIWEVKTSRVLLAKLEWIEKQTGLDLLNFCKVQLSQNPFDISRKRIKQLNKNNYTISCRTWTIKFQADSENSIIGLKNIFSNYSDEDLKQDSKNPYGDKEIHREFKKRYK